MFWRKSILAKLLLGIVLPVVLIFSISAVLILSQVRQNITTVTEGRLMAQSQAVSYQVSEYFTKYLELVRQMGCNQSVRQLLEETTQSGASQGSASYQMAAKSLDNILTSDCNLSLVWTADFDSGDSVRSGGVIRGKMTDYDITSRDWYQQTLDHDDIFITEPYEDSSTGKLVASIIQPMTSNGKKIGLVAIDLTVDGLKAMMAEHKLGASGFFALATSENNLIYHPNAEVIGQNFSELDISENIKAGVLSQAEGNYTYDSAGTPVRGYLSLVGGTGWKVMTGLPEAEFFQGYRAIQTSILLIFSAGLAVMIVIILLIALGIVRPLRALRRAAEKIADGDLNVAISIKSQDEVKQVSTALERTVERLKDYINYIDEISRVLGEIAGGNLLFSLNYDYVGEFAKVKVGLDHISDSLNTTLGEINRSAEQVASGADQVSSGAQALSQGATEQASSVEELAATINEVSQHIQGTADHARQATGQAENVGSEAQESNRRMKEMLDAMEDISGSSSEIGKIIKTIEDIAFQTNILALNAAVEAARAGAAGKGFAVVADEVRNLASKSAEASKSTAALIERSLHAVENGTRIADETAGSLERVVAGVKDVSSTITGISKAAGEQSQAILQVTTGMDQISAVVQTNSATAEESAAASEELSGQAEVLKSLVGQFRLKDHARI